MRTPRMPVTADAATRLREVTMAEDKIVNQGRRDFLRMAAGSTALLALMASPLAALAQATGRVLTDFSGHPSFTGPQTLMAPPAIARLIVKILHESSP